MFRDTFHPRVNITALRHNCGLTLIPKTATRLQELLNLGNSGSWRFCGFGRCISVGSFLVVCTRLVPERKVLSGTSTFKYMHDVLLSRVCTYTLLLFFRGYS